MQVNICGIPVTLNERARKVWYEIWPYETNSGHPKQIASIKLIEDELQAAVEEKADWIMRQHAKLRNETWFMDGYKKGLIDAAEIVEYAGTVNFNEQCLEVAKAIRVKALKVGK